MLHRSNDANETETREITQEYVDISFRYSFVIYEFQIYERHHDGVQMVVW